MYTEEQLKDLTKYLRETAKEITKSKKGNSQNITTNIGGTQITQIAPGSGLTLGLGPNGLSEDDGPDEDYLTIMDLVKQIEVIYYNPLIFQSILEEYDLPYSLMEDPLEMIALRINDAGALSKALIQWRLTNGI
jgi:hypothetical protein